MLGRGEQNPARHPADGGTKVLWMAGNQWAAPGVVSHLNCVPGETVSDTVVQPDATPAPTHPRCPDCAVAMWLVKVDRHVLRGDDDRLHYECKACGSTVTLLPQARAD
jgi:hypothetical protein